MFSGRRAAICRVEVREAADGDFLRAARVRIAPGERPMMVRRSGHRYRVEVVDGPLANRHEASVDVLFRSVSRSAGPNALGILMTGMGDDGARGLQEMRDAGAPPAAILLRLVLSCPAVTMPEFASPAFWIAVLQIIAIDILLGGDNAVVIALACRRLPEAQRNKGIFWGVVGAIGLRVVLIFFALQLLAVPYLKIVGALLLFWIGVKLLLPEHEEGHGDVAASTTLAGAVKTIIIADAVMSLDNVIAVAGAAKGSMALVVFGIVVSIPIVVWGSKLVLRLMDRYPFVITAGGALLGWIGGGMLLTDPAMPKQVAEAIPYAHHVFALAGAAAVVVIGKALAARRGGAPAAPARPDAANDSH